MLVSKVFYERFGMTEPRGVSYNEGTICLDRACVEQDFTLLVVCYSAYAAR